MTTMHSNDDDLTRRANETHEAHLERLNRTYGTPVKAQSKPSATAATPITRASLPTTSTTSTSTKASSIPTTLSAFTAPELDAMARKFGCSRKQLAEAMAEWDRDEQIREDCGHLLETHLTIQFPDGAFRSAMTGR